ncbi:transglutaminase [Nitratireductor indicus C115]|uniref:Transglutaminase n=2 Tax=Nitratireductor indicus TaxID=721133 RepID=K2NQN3_9HYPH|nr:transglutaminase [Nitratireductor indicus C115]SFQ68393.1 Predicted transglutaminase-like cysteine proteinase [Nitratireductor indicus]
MMAAWRGGFLFGGHGRNVAAISRGILSVLCRGAFRARSGFALTALSGVLLAIGLAQAEAGNSMATGGLTSQPIGHYEFCKANPLECSLRPRDTGPEKMNKALWRKLVSVNKSVNQAVKPMNDIDIYGEEEVWTYPSTGVGDCEDYVLEKRRALMRKGISLANLLITVVRKPDGEGHAILTVRTDRGDFVLDNLNDTVKLWNQTGYRYLKRQASNHTGMWVSLREDNNPVVGAVSQ